MIAARYSESPLARALAALCVLVLGACEADAADKRIETLVLAAGDYSRLSWGGTQAERFYALAQRQKGDVVVISPDRERPCSLGELAWYSPQTPANAGPYVLGAPSPALIPVIPEFDGDGHGTLGFVDLGCERAALEVPGIAVDQLWRISPGDPTEVLFLLRNAALDLVVADPWRDEQLTVATGVEGLSVNDQYVWLIERGRAAARDFRGRVLTQFGTNVVKVLPLDGLDLVAYQDDRGVALRSHGEETRIAEDACRLGLLGGVSLALTFFSPCAERALVVQLPDEPLTTVATGVSDFESAAGALLFTQDTETQTRLQLAFPLRERAPVTLGTLPRSQLDRVVDQSGRNLLFSTVGDDERLRLWRAITTAGDEQLQPLEQDVVALRLGITAFATIDGAGRLVLRARDGYGVIFRDAGVAAAGSRFVFGTASSALAYFTELDPETRLGTLHLQFVEHGEHFVVDDQVREYREVYWPERGILYARGGEHPELRFARVDIPCEDLTETPWACSF